MILVITRFSTSDLSVSRQLLKSVPLKEKNQFFFLVSPFKRDTVLLGKTLGRASHPFRAPAVQEQINITQDTF